MAAKQLEMHRVEKPWGRRTLWPGFADPGADEAPVGEVWFQSSGDAEPVLLVKYLFTSEKLSIQVHPDDALAQAQGYPRGKDEAWLVLDAEPGATIGLGTLRPLDSDMLRAAAQDGSIKTLLDWKPVKKGDFIYSPARTIHAIGPGLTLVEIQQNVDLTYRFYDFGRPRETHLDLAVEAADASPFVSLPRPAQNGVGQGREILAQGPKFVVERRCAANWSVDLGDKTGWLVPVTGAGEADGVAWQAGDCLAIHGHTQVRAEQGADVLLAYPGDSRI